MSKSLFYKFVNKVLNVEQGYSNNPNDSGGPTNWGITQSKAREHGFSGDMRNLSRQKALEIYKADYWDEILLDNVGAFSEQLAYEMFDTGVNCGTGTSAVFLQRSLNVLNDKERYYKDITVDGLMGPSTLHALDMYFNTRGHEGLKVLTTMLNCLQGARYVTLCEQNEKDETFMYGWASKRL